MTGPDTPVTNAVAATAVDVAATQPPLPPDTGRGGLSAADGIASVVSGIGDGIGVVVDVVSGIVSIFDGL